MIVDRALAYVEMGWSVFPLVPNTKKPLTKNGFKDASKSVYLVKKWWTEHSDANIGIATGLVSGVVVVDVDVKGGINGMESLAALNGETATLTAKTPSGGIHLYYTAPEGGLRCRNGLMPGIDLKADGGYVVAPGSVIDDKPYEWLDGEAHIITVPSHVTNLMSKGSGAKSAATPQAGETITEGLRNSTLASMAGAMRRKGMGNEEISAALKAVNTKRCSPPLPDTEVESISTSIARYPPEPDEDEAMPPGFTDDALALEFTQLTAADWRYIAGWGNWLHWEGSHWQKETTLRAYDLARLVCRKASARCIKPKIAAKVASAATVAAVERLARADRRHAAKADQWDTDPYLFNTPGGTCILRGGAGRPIPHKREDYLTKLATASPGTEYPAWKSFLSDITAGNEELQHYLARVAGYALTGISTEHVMFFLHGSGANGKSVFLNTLASVWGEYATQAPIDSFMETRGDRHPTDMAKLRGARLVIATEVSQGKRWDEAKIKALTGGDTISARFMRQDFFDYKPQFKLLIAGNHKPSLRNVDEAMRRRIHLIPFTVTIPPEKRDQTLPNRLLTEKGGILGWALQGCAEWQRIGLKPPACVLAATEEYFESQDALGRWLDEECIKSERATTTTEDAFGVWKVWAEKQGEYVGSMRKFTEEMCKRGFQRWRSGLKRGLRGLSLRGKEVQEEML